MGEIMRRIKLRAKPKYEISFRYTVLEAITREMELLLDVCGFVLNV